MSAVQESCEGVPSLADAPVAWVSMDEADRIVGWNAAAEALLGWRREEILGALLAETLIPAALRADHHAGIARYRQTGVTILAGRPVAVAAQHRDGGTVEVEMLLWIGELDGERRYHATFRPTAVAAVDDEVQVAEARYQRLAQSVPGMVFQLDVVGEDDLSMRYVSAGSADVYGHDAATLMRRPELLLEVLHEEDSRSFHRAWRHARASEEPLRWEGRIRHADGGVRWIRVAARPVHTARGSVHWDGIVLDQTESRQAEEMIHRQARELESHHAFLDTVLAHQSDPVVACDARGTLTVFNDAAKVLHGKDPSTGPSEAWARTYDLLDTAGRPMRPEDVPLSRALRGETVVAVPMKVGSADGTGPVRDLLATGQQLRGPDGELLGAVLTMRDVTESLATQRRLEHAAEALAARNSELEAANRFKVDLIGMLGHEVRTPLTSITGYAEILSDVVDEDLDALDHLRVIRRNAKRLDTVVRNVLAMVAAGAGRLAANRSTFRVCPLLEEAAADVHDGAPPPRVECEEALVLHADQSHVEQILTNLLSNATKYGDGAALLEARRVEDAVTIRVTDRGSGVPVELQEELFDRFTRAEAMAHLVSGSGLGLHIARELARANGGDLAYEHREGGGATFVLTLPDAER